ncbi:MAG: amino acid adenylation domain-containing protein [Candidatus Dactylopiibacterium sp.]|nr:amino acid adenylation domain-containing protein [Candidatus Dactylopiibacterium sp.]
MLAEHHVGQDDFCRRLAASFHRHAYRLALECGDARLTYRELDLRAQALTRVLRRNGVQPGECVALLLPRSVELVVAQLAVLRAGALYAPIDLASPPERQRAMLAVLGARVHLDAGQDLPALPADAVRVNVSALPREAGAPFQPWLACPEPAAAYVMFTSGTTGAPKGVVVPRAGIARLVLDTDYAVFRRDARWAFLSSPAFDAATLEVWAPLLHGACCVIQDAPLPAIDTLADFLVTRRISDAWLTAALFNVCADLRPDAFGGLSQLLIGGERVCPRHAGSVLERWPALRLINAYGPTENTTFTLTHRLTPADCAQAEVPIGRPIRGTTVRIAADGAVGELLVGGLGVAHGYLNDPEQSARKFLEDGDGRWYRTGDLVRRREDGVFEFLGRVDRQVKIQGHRIELDEVERCLNACAGVAQGAVLVAGADAQSRHLVAFFAGEPGLGAPDAASLRAELMTQLPPNAVPSVLRALAALPLNLNGKLDRKALQALAETAPAAVAEAAPAFASETERVLAELWRECLPGPVSGPGADFWLCGGSSLLALQLAALIRQRLGKSVSPVEILRQPVLAELARRLDARVADTTAGAADTSPCVPLMPTQCAKLVFERDVAGAGRAERRVLFECTARFGAARLREAFARLAALHAALRLRFDTAPTPPVAHLAPALAEGWWRVSRELAEPDAEWPAATEPLDLARTGVMRVDLRPLAGGASQLCWTVHRAALDDASLERCLTQLHALLEGADVTPAYGAIAACAAREAARADADAEAALAGAIRTALGDRPLPPALVTPAPARNLSLAIPAQVSARCLRLCQQHGHSPALALFAAWVRALHTVLGHAVPVTIVQSLRTEAQLIEPVGYCAGKQLLLFPAEASAAQIVAEAGAAQTRWLDQGGPETMGVAAHLPESLEGWARAAAFVWGAPLAGVQREGLSALEQGPGVLWHGLALRGWLVGERLHICLYATAAGFGSGLAARLLMTLAEKLAQLDLPAEPGLAAAPAAALGAGLDASLRGLWTRELGRPPAGDDANFLLAGGSVHGALALAAQVRHQLGAQISPGRFLARPAWSNLVRLVAEADETGCAQCEIIGPADAARLIVLLPGMHGGIVSVYRLGELLQRECGADVAVAVLDLDLMMEGAPAADPGAHLLACCVEKLEALGAARVAGIVGMSLGGLVALRLAEELVPAAPPPVCLLDTFAPQLYAQSRLRALEWVGANLVFGAPGAVLRRFRRKAARVLSGVAGGLGLRWRAPLPVAAWQESINPRTLAGWCALRTQLSQQRVANARQSVALFVAQRSVPDYGVLRRRRTNGFARRDFAALRAQTLDVCHDDMTRTAVGETAHAVALGFNLGEGDGRGAREGAHGHRAAAVLAA